MINLIRGKLVLLAGLFVLVLAAPLLAQSGGPYAITDWAISGTDNILQSSNGACTLSSVLQQPAASLSFSDPSNRYTLRFEFAPSVATPGPATGQQAPGQRLYLPLILK